MRKGLLVIARFIAVYMFLVFWNVGVGRLVDHAKTGLMGGVENSFPFGFAL